MSCIVLIYQTSTYHLKNDYVLILIKLVKEIHINEVFQITVKLLKYLHMSQNQNLSVCKMVSENPMFLNVGRS